MMTKQDLKKIKTDLDSMIFDIVEEIENMKDLKAKLHNVSAKVMLELSLMGEEEKKNG